MTLTSQDSRTSPMAGQAAAEILAAVDETTIPEPPDNLVELPGGWINSQGGVEQLAEIRELTGADEEALSRCTKDGTVDWRRFVGEIMSRGLVKLGDTPATASMIETLLVGDQTAILLGIRRATYGDEYETSITCPFCSKSSDVAYDLRPTTVGGDIEFRRLADPENLFRTIQLRHGEAEIRLATAGDQNQGLKDDRLTTTEQNTIMLARCVRAVSGKPILGETTMRAMGAGDRRILSRHLVETQPGPQLGEVKGQCPVCSREVTISLNIPALFL
jgi:hypothetical protein